jgi:hypothetical protein
MKKPMQTREIAIVIVRPIALNILSRNGKSDLVFGCIAPMYTPHMNMNARYDWVAIEMAVFTHIYGRFFLVSVFI